MSHFGRSGHRDIADTYSLLVLNISFRTTADDLHPLFDKYGRVIDIFIPRDRRTGESRGFAFVRYKYQDEAQKAVDRLDGRVVDGREIAVQFAKYGPNAKRIQKGRITEKLSKRQGGSSSPQRRYQDDYYRNRDYRERSRSRSLDRYERDRYHEREQDHIQSRSYSGSPDYDRGRGRIRYDGVRRSRSSFESASPPLVSHSSHRSLSPRRTPPPRNQSPKSCSPRRTTSPGNLSSQKRLMILETLRQKKMSDL